MRKISYVIVLFLTLSGVVMVPSVFAQGGGPHARKGQGMKQRQGGGMGAQGKMRNLTTEQREKLRALKTKHQAEPCNGDAACRDVRRAERDAILNSAQ